ncbi:MAG: spermidine/putrescine ABC transporter substrate-binding protein [Moorea sp. SIO2B7]|nr:spermidine/putrescine ABC transporter substrate-binding protein [Moorena sp. SIO2B7]
MTTRRRFLQTAGATLSGLTLSSCGWTLANVRQSAPTSGSSDELYIYTWAGYTDKELLDRFEEETGIRAIADVFDSNESMLARIQASGGGSYSIIYPSDYMVQKMAELGLLTPLDKSRIIGLEQLFSGFRNPNYDPGDKYSVPLSWGTTGLVYNRKKLPEKPEDWDYLWKYKEKLSKRITLLNDVREVMGATLRMLGYSYNAKDPKQIRAAYQKLADLKPAIASFSSDAWRSQILTGDLLIAMCYSSDANEVMLENEDLQYVLPLSGSSLWADTLVIPRTAPNPEGGYAWINFMLKPDVVARICERLSFATPNQKAFNILPKEVRNNVSLFPPQPALGNSEGLIPLPDEISELYDRYWTKLTSA